MKQMPEQPGKESLINKIPTILWVIIIPAVLFGGIAGIIATFWALATVEGVASIALIVAAILVVHFENKVKVTGQKPNKLITAIAISFFALMGMSVDQPGNFLYNKPLGWAFCPSQTNLERYVDISNPLPGTTYVIQEFRCVDDSGKKVKELGMTDLMLGRFVEYVLIGYALIYLNKLISYFRERKNPV
ncbi:MAG: hypothetical protein ACRCZE_04705 [Candidatus Altimarinota bacterium]